MYTYTGDQALAAHAGGPLPEAHGPGRGTKKFKDSTLRSYERSTGPTVMVALYVRRQHEARRRHLSGGLSGQ